MNNLGLGLGPMDNTGTTTAPSGGSWWQQVGAFVSKATEVFNTAKPVIAQTKQAINEFKTNTQNDPAFNYGIPSGSQGGLPGQNTGLSMGAKIAIGATVAIGLGVGVYLVTRKKKKGLSGPDAPTIDTTAEVVESKLSGPAKPQKKGRKRKSK